MPIDLQELRKHTEQLVLDWFPDHKATLTILPDPRGGEITKLIWAKPGTRINRIDYLIYRNVLFVTGDLGDAVYEFSSILDLPFLADCDLDYFGGKCRASSEEPRGRTWSHELAQKWIEEKLAEWAEENPLPCPTCCNIDALLESLDPELPCPTCKGEETVPRTPLTFEECAELMRDEDSEYLEDVIHSSHSWGLFVSETTGLILSNEKFKEDDDSFGRKRRQSKEEYPRFSFDSEYYEVGRTWDIRTRGHLKGLKLAWKQLQNSDANLL